MFVYDRNANGGSELMASSVESHLDKNLTDKFQIFVSRLTEPFDNSKIPILWLHDLPGDPASDHLKNGGWQKFEKIVAVSNWQMQAYINYYQIPWSKMCVIENAIVPFEKHTKPDDKISLAYWSTPHRGLEILVPVFEKLAEKHDNLELNVFSSFNLYGWPQRDEPYQQLFDRCRKHPNINYYGSIANSELRQHLRNNHILAYPCIWPETSCITLIEAMSANMTCVHSNLAALPETAGGMTSMYQYHEDPSAHASIFMDRLDKAIHSIKDDRICDYYDYYLNEYAERFNIYNVIYLWERLLEDCISSVENRKNFFVYRP